MREELRGRVNEFGEACVDIRFLSNNMTYSFLIDTGFNGSLCLPAETAEELKLNLEEQTTFYGVGDYYENIDIGYTEIEWLGKAPEVSVLVNKGNDFLLGTALLENKELYINYKTSEVLLTQTQ
jgi:clan AA aspartic protease